MFSRIKGLFKIIYIDGMFGCLLCFAFIFISLHEKSPDVLPYNAMYTCNEKKR